MRLIVRAEDFVVWFTRVVPGAHRQITVDDVKDLTTCGLIGMYGFYMQLDIETVRAILQCELLRQNRENRDEIRDSEGIMHCRGCGAVLPETDGKRGRPKEYCPDCDASRSTHAGSEVANEDEGSYELNDVASCWTIVGPTAVPQVIKRKGQTPLRSLPFLINIV
jgi:hypothetical protein